jgi:hypothetical protein
VQILKAARALGDFLLVGLHPDSVITAHRGTHHPIMNLHERSLSVLACRYVDEVIIGAPWEVTKDLVRQTTAPCCGSTRPLLRKGLRADLHLPLLLYSNSSIVARRWPCVSVPAPHVTKLGPQWQSSCGAAWCVQLTTFNISLVVHGTRAEPNDLASEKDAYALPKVRPTAATNQLDSARTIACGLSHISSGNVARIQAD